MLDTQSQNNGLQGGGQTVSPDTRVPQESGGDGLQQPVTQDVLTQPSAQISLPLAGQSQTIQETSVSGSDVTDSPFNTAMLVGVFALALFLILLLAKFAQPATQEDQGQQAEEPVPEEGANSQKSAHDKPPRKNKKKSRRERRKNA